MPSALLLKSAPGIDQNRIDTGIKYFLIPFFDLALENSHGINIILSLQLRSCYVRLSGCPYLQGRLDLDADRASFPAEGL